MIDLLIGIAVLIDLFLASGESDDRRAGEVGILESGGHVGRPDRLSPANADSPAHPRVAVRHVGCSLFPVGHNALDPEFLHFPQRRRHNHGHEKEMGYSVAVECFGNVSASLHLGHSFSSYLSFRSRSIVPNVFRVHVVRSANDRPGRHGDFAL